MKILEKELDSNKVLELVEKLKINTTMAKILLNRGMDYEKARIAVKDFDLAILDPRRLNNAKEASDVIVEYALNPNAEIWIFGDYDADGIISNYILASAIRKVAKCKVNVYYPERSEGYGINNSFCEKLVHDNQTRKADILVITVDNGITKVDEIAYLKANGMEVIVTDHHQPKEKVPDCIIVNPHYNNPTDEYKYLAGCGVAFKVAQLILWHFDRGEEMMEFIYALAIGTLGDVMPLSMENIAFVQYGLKQINGKNCPRGIKAFKEYIGKKTLTATDIIWDIVPRVNACGRMGNTSLAAKMFFVEDLECDTELDDVINAIERINTERKNLTDKAKKQIGKKDFSNYNVIVVDSSEYPEGISGIIAGKIVEMFNKPAVVISGRKDIKTASARSIDGINLQELLNIELKKETIVEFGGHPVAAGIKLHKDKINEFRKSINETIKEIQIPDDRIDQILESEIEEIYIDDTIKINDITEKYYDSINCIPYDGKTVPNPIFLLKEVNVLDTKKSGSNPDNICFTLKDKTGKAKMWAWGLTKAYEELGSPSKINIIGSIERNFQNKRDFTLRIAGITEA